MIIKVHDITEKVRCMKACEPVADYKSLLELQNDEGCTFLEPLSLDFKVLREYDHIRVEGSVETRVALNCARCLTGYETRLASSFTIFYSKDTGIPQDEEVELTERELISATYDGDEIDLAPEVAEHVIMELPVKPLCSESCRGLCSSCGIDLNAGSCDCGTVNRSNAFSAIKNLKLD